MIKYDYMLVGSSWLEDSGIAVVQIYPAWATESHHLLSVCP